MQTQEDYIGMAEMKEDRTVVLFLRAEGPNGQVGHSELLYTPSQAKYEEILKHVGPLKPGERKPVRPWN